MAKEIITNSPIASVPVSIRGGMETPPSTGTVRIVTWSKEERSKRAFKMLGMCWGGAVLCAPIPLIHFTVLPALLVGGVVMFFRLSAEQTLILDGQGICPECQKTFKIARAADRFPMDELCENCNSSVSIDRA